MADPGGLSVKFSMLHFGSPSLVPGRGPTPLIYQWPCCGSDPHTKWRKMGTDVSSGIIFLKQKEEDWQQMLGQGQSSSPRKKRKKDEKDKGVASRTWQLPLAVIFTHLGSSPGTFFLSFSLQPGIQHSETKLS